jgi:hypothetical protein
VSCSARLLDLFIITAVLARYQLPVANPVALTPIVDGATGPDRARPTVRRRPAQPSGVGVVLAGLASTHSQDVSGVASQDEPAQVLMDQWQTLPLERRRQRITALLQHVIVSPSSHRGRYFDPERLELVWHATGKQ